MLAAAVAATALAGCANPAATAVSPSDSSTAAEIPVAAKDESLATLVPERLRSAGSINVATSAPFEPYEMFAGPGSTELIGLEIDLGHAIGETLGIPFKFSQQPFEGLIPGMQAGKYDVLMATLFDTPEREVLLDFVNYARTGSGIMVKVGTDDIKGLGDLCGKPAGIQNGSMQAELLADENLKCSAAAKPPIDVKAFPTQSDQKLALNGGTIAAIVSDLPALAYAAKQDPTFKLVEDPAAPSGYISNLIGVGVRKTDEGFAEAVAGAVKKLMETGIYKAILDKYGVSQTSIPEPIVNQHGG